MRIGLTGIYVDDQDRAERFYTEVLGFKVKTSAPYGPNERWLTVVSPEDPDGVELVLHLTDEPARTFRQATREQGRPVISLTTTDCAGDAARLKARGVVFVKEPGRPAATSSTSTRTEPLASPRTALMATASASAPRSSVSREEPLL